MKTPENGLVSRFVYYILSKNKIFKDVFSDEKKEYKVYFEELSKLLPNSNNILKGLGIGERLRFLNR